MLRMGRQGNGTSAILSGSSRNSRKGALVKGLGYLISIVSVLLLGAAALKTASQDRVLLLCLVAGMAASIVGMGLRYWSYRRDEA
jgi:membrane protein DedA with SNARE-associated domain